MATKITSRVLADDAIVRATLGDDAIGVAEIADDAVTTAAIADDVALGGNPTTTTQSTANSTTRIATTAFVQAAIDTDISALIDSAPGTLNTLNEIAAALNDDPSFTTTVNNAIALKAPIANAVFTGNSTFDTNTLYVDGSSNEVGIGNTNPDYQLHISGGGDLLVEDTGNGSAHIRLRSSNSGTATSNWKLKTSSNNYFYIDNDTGSAGTAIAIDNTGKVGIGDTAPQDWLEVRASGAIGGVTISSSSHDQAALSFARNSAATARIYTTEPGASNTSSMHFQTGIASGPALVTAMTIDETQKVGIGTTSPRSALHVVGNITINASSNAPYIDFVEHGATDDPKARIAMDQISGTDGQLLFYTEDGGTLAEKLRIADAGQIGIGGANYGSDGQVLTSTGASTAPAWESLAASTIDALSDAKSGGANFGSSLMIGTQTTGTLSNASGNTAVGIAAMDAITSGVNNVFIGYLAGSACDTGDRNVAIGNRAMDISTDAQYNIAIGNDALGSCTSGSSNTAIGTNVMAAVTSGGNNVAIGRNALDASGVHHFNVAVGSNTLSAQTGDCYSTAVGDSAMAANVSGAYNVAVGRLALSTNQTGQRNTAIGYSALGTNTGSYNTAVGHFALTGNTSGGENVAIGDGALDANTEGDANVAAGNGALSTNITGNNNTAFGKQALYLSTGNENTAVGYKGLYSNTSASANVAVGFESLMTNQTGTYGTAVGYRALKATTVSSNTAVGAFAGQAITSGGSNIAIGTYSLMGVCTGSYNVAVGVSALAAVTSGGENICIGRDAGNDISSANQNVAVGHESLTKNLTGTGNVAVGFQALENSTGGGNTAIGWKAGESNEGGVWNVFIGENTGGSHPSHSQAIVIGRNITAAAGVVGIGTDGLGKISSPFSSSVSWSGGSDVRLKQNINDSTLGLNFINNLRPVTFKWKPNNELPKEWSMYREENEKDTDTLMTGLIAQEVKEAIDESGVENFNGWSEDDEGMQQLAPAGFVFPLIKAVKELSAKNAELEARIATLEG